MENKITVNICGTDYTLMAEESPSYMQKVAALVDARMGEIMASGRISRMDAAVLAAANIADELLKQQSSTENLRSQLKGYLDEANRAKNELSECKREIFKLQQQLATINFCILGQFCDLGVPKLPRAIRYYIILVIGREGKWQSPFMAPRI